MRRKQLTIKWILTIVLLVLGLACIYPFFLSLIHI